MDSKYVTPDEPSKSSMDETQVVKSGVKKFFIVHATNYFMCVEDLEKMELNELGMQKLEKHVCLATGEAREAREAVFRPTPGF